MVTVAMMYTIPMMNLLVSDIVVTLLDFVEHGCIVAWFCRCQLLSYNYFIGTNPSVWIYSTLLGALK